MDYLRSSVEIPDNDGGKGGYQARHEACAIPSLPVEPKDKGHENTGCDDPHAQGDQGNYLLGHILGGVGRYGQYDQPHSSGEEEHLIISDRWPYEAQNISGKGGGCDQDYSAYGGHGRGESREKYHAVKATWKQ